MIHFFKQLFSIPYELITSNQDFTLRVIVFIILHFLRGNEFLCNYFENICIE